MAWTYQVRVTSDNGEGWLAHGPYLLISPPTNDVLIALAQRWGRRLKNYKIFYRTMWRAELCQGCTYVVEAKNSFKGAQYEPIKPRPPLPVGHESLASLVTPQNQYCLAPASTSGVAHAGSSSWRLRLHRNPTQIQLDLVRHPLRRRARKRNERKLPLFSKPQNAFVLSV